MPCNGIIPTTTALCELEQGHKGPHGLREGFFDCDFLKLPPRRKLSRIEEPPAISPADLVRLWQKSGVITHYPRVGRAVRMADLVGIVAMATVIAACLGYLFGTGAF